METFLMLELASFHDAAVCNSDGIHQHFINTVSELGRWCFVYMGGVQSILHIFCISWGDKLRNMANNCWIKIFWAHIPGPECLKCGWTVSRHSIFNMCYGPATFDVIFWGILEILHALDVLLDLDHLEGCVCEPLVGNIWSISMEYSATFGIYWVSCRLHSAAWADHCLLHLYGTTACTDYLILDECNRWLLGSWAQPTE